MPEDRFFAAEFDDGIFIIDGRCGAQFNDDPLLTWDYAEELCAVLNATLTN